MVRPLHGRVHCAMKSYFSEHPSGKLSGSTNGALVTSKLMDNGVKQMKSPQHASSAKEQVFVTLCFRYILMMDGAWLINCY